MHPRPIRILCLLVLLACASLAHAQHAQPVYRCIGAQGEPVFSGQPCGTPAPGTNAPAQDTGSSVGCAPSPEALRQAIAAAFATRDVNQLAGLILWQGMDQGSARNALRSLASWLKQPLTGVAFTRATGPPFEDTDSGPPPATTGGGPAGVSSVAPSPPTGLGVSTGGVDGATRDFGVVESGGCWWLTF